MRAPADLAYGLDRYRERHPGQASLVDEFEALRSEGRPAFQRARLAGHFTASAFLVSEDGRRALLLHHAKLDRWLQPGGHSDGDTDLASVALREAEEETGLRELRVETDIFDIDRHRIPARGAEPEHWHYDVRYVVRCSGDESPRINSESRAFAWRPIEDLAGDGSLDPSIRRMAARWLAR
ncbi:NUDIX hydrolase [Silanimonas algicola]